MRSFHVGLRSLHYQDSANLQTWKDIYIEGSVTSTEYILPLLAKQPQILLTLAIAMEYLHRSHTALCYVMRNARQYYSRNSSHMRIVSYCHNSVNKTGIMSPELPGIPLVPA